MSNRKRINKKPNHSRSRQKPTTGQAQRSVRPSDLTERQSYLFKMFSQQVEGDRKNGTTTGGAWMSKLVGLAEVSTGTPVTVGDHGQFEPEDILLVGDLFGVTGARPNRGFSMVMSEGQGVFGNIGEAVDALVRAEANKSRGDEVEKPRKAGEDDLPPLPPKPDDLEGRAGELFDIFCEYIEEDRKDGTDTGREYLIELKDNVAREGVAVVAGHGVFSSADFFQIVDEFEYFDL